MKSSKFIAAFLLALATISCADTFVHKKTGESFTGFATTKKAGDKTIVITQEKKLRIIPNYYDITYNSKGRRNEFATIQITDGPKYELEIKALEKDIAKATDKGYLFVILEIDARGGKRYYNSILSSAIVNNWSCPVYCYIHGEGIHDYVAILALACEKTFIANNAFFGSEIIHEDEEEEKTNTKMSDMRKAIGSNVGEKFTSILRATASSLADKHNRPAILAQAMFDEQIEVVEVKTKDGSAFIEVVNQKEHHEKIKVWSKKGQFLQLGAEDAVKTGMADKIFDSRVELISSLGGGNSLENNLSGHIDAREKMDSVIEEIKMMNKKIKELNKTYESTSNMRKKITTCKSIMRCYKKLSNIGQSYPETQIDPDTMKRIIEGYNYELNSIKNGR